jgi:hypothetical protein
MSDIVETIDLHVWFCGSKKAVHYFVSMDLGDFEDLITSAQETGFLSFEDDDGDCQIINLDHIDCLKY